MVSLSLSMGPHVEVYCRIQESAMWGVCASWSSGSFQFDYNLNYLGSVLLKLLPVYELFYVGHLTLLPSVPVVPICHRSKHKDPM